MVEREVTVGDGPSEADDGPVVASVILITEDRWWADDISRALRREGFRVSIDEAGASAFDHRARSVDAVILDHRLRARPATAICLAWRRRAGTPILVVAETTDEAVVLDVFAAGADHVLTPQMSHRQLVAWLRSSLRRQTPRRRRDDELGPDELPVRLAPDGRAALVHGRAVDLGPQEVEILGLLLSRAGRVVTRAELSHCLVSAHANARAVDFFVRRLREKLEAVDPVRRIRVVRGVGFTFDVGEPTEEHR